MMTFAETCGFKTESCTRFEINGHRHRVGRDGGRTLRHLETMYQSCVAARPNWSLRSRDMVRDIERWNSQGVLSFVVTQTRDPILRRLAIWLRGRCRGTMGTASIAMFASDGEHATRKEVARALRRMSDWNTLAWMATEDRSSRIRRLAAARPPRPKEERLQGFLSNVRVEADAEKQHDESGCPVPLQCRPLFIAEHVAKRLAELFRYAPVKSAAQIRVILDRIRRAVSGA